MQASNDPAARANPSAQFVPPARVEQAVSGSLKPEDKKEVSDAEFQKAFARVKNSLSFKNTQLEIDVDKDTNRVIAKVTDRQTGELIRQIPSREFVEWEKEFTRIIGLLFDKKV